MKKLFFVLMVFFLAIQSGCSSRPTPVAYLPHMQNQSQKQNDGSSLSRSASAAAVQNQKNMGGTKQSGKPGLQNTVQRKRIYIETHKPLTEYTGFIYSELVMPVSNALTENNFAVTQNREQADLIAVLDFGSEGIRKITKTICTPHYEDIGIYPDYSYARSGSRSNYEYDYYFNYGSVPVQTGTDCYPKEYSVYPHTLKVTCYEGLHKNEGQGPLLWEVELVYQSQHNEYRANIKTLASRLSRQLRDVTVWNNKVRIEFDTIGK